MTGHRGKWPVSSPRSVLTDTKCSICPPGPSARLPKPRLIFSPSGWSTLIAINDIRPVFSQENLSLPPGPLLLNPESALRSFKREVIDRQPDIFKIDCLNTLKDLYEKNPYFAGYGNKPTDVTAYQVNSQSLSCSVNTDCDLCAGGGCEQLSYIHHQQDRECPAPGQSECGHLLQAAGGPHGHVLPPHHECRAGLLILGSSPA